MITTFMNLELPTVTVTLGPEWAYDVNAAFEVIDTHDHSSGKGVKVKTAGIDINADLSFSNFRAEDLVAVQFQSQVSPLSGASNSNLLHVSGGDLYFVNGSGTAIQITDGSNLVPSPGVVNAFEITSISGNLSISPTDTFVIIRVDTTASRTITLPLASAVAPGRTYIIKDLTGDANDNPITIARSGSDTIEGAAADAIMDSNLGSIWVIGDGVSNWVLA